MITASGAKVFPTWDDRHTGDIPDLADIARGLSRQSRWCGQTEHFFSGGDHNRVGCGTVSQHHIHIVRGINRFADRSPDKFNDFQFRLKTL